MAVATNSGGNETPGKRARDLLSHVEEDMDVMLCHSGAQTVFVNGAEKEPSVIGRGRDWPVRKQAMTTIMAHGTCQALPRADSLGFHPRFSPAIEDDLTSKGDVKSAGNPISNSLSVAVKGERQEDLCPTRFPLA